MMTGACYLTRAVIAAGQFLFAITANALSGALIGHFADIVFHSRPWGTAAGAAIGWGIGLCWAYRQILILLKREQNEAEKERYG